MEPEVNFELPYSFIFCQNCNSSSEILQKLSLFKRLFFSDVLFTATSRHSREKNFRPDRLAMARNNCPYL